MVKPVLASIALFALGVSAIGLKQHPRLNECFRLTTDCSPFIDPIETFVPQTMLYISNALPEDLENNKFFTQKMKIYI
ncbi:hypothetical protein EDC96DRAFT_513465 [Choanephora cucurbitarum]|nr:hypothetical protein EDC96DRAFT_513465 [Choanephora cucurbitarum]